MQMGGNAVRLGNDTCPHPHPARGTAGLTLRPLTLLSKRFKAISQAGILALRWLPAQNAWEKTKRTLVRDHKIGSILPSKSSDLDVNNRKTEGEDTPEKPVCKTIPKGY
ncbi:unnamed protein product [Coccothraustes coccothraustes]